MKPRLIPGLQRFVIEQLRDTVAGVRQRPPAHASPRPDVRSRLAVLMAEHGVTARLTVLTARLRVLTQRVEL